MRLDTRRVLSVIVLTSIAVAATGCSHNTLSGSSQDLSVTFTPSPSGAGRYVGVGNDSASFIIKKLLLLPADPATAALYGTQPLLIRFDPFTANLTQTEDEEFSRIALSTGTYRVAVIEVSPLALIDDNVDPGATECIEKIAVIDGDIPSGRVADVAFNFPNSGDTPANLTFTIRPDQTKLALKVNVPGLITGYENSYTCQLGCGPGGSPCLTAFSVANFRAALLANMTLE